MALRVLVTQAGGRVGKELVAHLAEAKKGGRDVFIRACSRNPAGPSADKLRKIGADEVVEFDYKSEATFGPALQGMNAVFSASPDPEADGHAKFSTLLGDKSLGIKHVVRLSCFGADTVTASYDPDVHASLKGEKIPGMLRGYWRDEETILNSIGKSSTTVLRANFFQGHILKPETGNIDSEGFFQAPLGSTRNSFVSTNDIGESAAVVFLGGVEQHGNKFYDLTGPYPASLHDCAADLTKVLGKPVVYREQDIDQFEKDFGPQRRAFFEYLRCGFYTRCSPDFYNLTGRKPQAFVDYLQQPGKAGETGLEDMWKAGMWSKGKNVMEGHEK
eukprot:TRINITY_DN445_c0_g1_i16.p1 TRINITY_DN445_c0_g1~~TRINITY_DN445_c0_g1_i16.p1  ORF type:complete len:331 (+),score=151.30 TRINITY_DN445_c0_g1_i16:82-1074(+)